MRSLLPVLALTVGVLASILAIAAIPPDRGRVVAVFSPMVTATELLLAVKRADARLVAGGGMPGTVVVFGDRGGLPARLKREGALIVLDPLGATGCAAVAPPKSSPFHRS